MTHIQFHKAAKILATVLILGQGAYYAITQPGLMDSFNATMGGIAIYAIWLAREKTANDSK